MITITDNFGLRSNTYIDSRQLVPTVADLSTWNNSHGPFPKGFEVCVEATGEWYSWNGSAFAARVTSGGGSAGVTTLAALTDVNTTGAETGSVLKYDSASSKWIIGTDNASGASGEPDKYLKTIVKDGNTYTVTPNTGASVSFTIPSDSSLTSEQEAFINALMEGTPQEGGDEGKSVADIVNNYYAYYNNLTPEQQAQLDDVPEFIEDLKDVKDAVGNIPSTYLKSISKTGNTYTIKNQSNNDAASFTIPTVNNATVTFALADQEHTAGGNFTLNQSENATIYLPVPGEGGTTVIENPYDITTALGYTTSGTNYAVQIASGKLYVNVPTSTGGVSLVKSITLDDNGSASLDGEGSIYLQGLDGIKTKFNNNVISLYLEDQFKVDMQSALETAAQSLIDVGDLEERVAALEAIEPGDGGTSPSTYLKSITKSGNTYTIKDQANTETSWTIPTIPTIPTVNNSTVTFAIADAEHPAGGSFTLNQVANATIYLPASTGEGGTTYIENPFDISLHSITELSDVDTSGTKDDGYTLVYNQSNGKWVPAAPFGGSLGSLSNVTITSPAEGQVLKFTGQKWENGTVDFSGVTSIKVNESNTVDANSNGVADISDAMSGYQTKLKSTDVIGTINNQELKYGDSITIPTSSGDENVIETIKVNGAALTPDSNKAVDITVPNLNISTTTPTTGQVLKWNGTQWAPATDNTSEGGSDSWTLVADNKNQDNQYRPTPDDGDIYLYGAIHQDGTNTKKYVETTVGDYNAAIYIDLTESTRDAIDSIPLKYLKSVAKSGNTYTFTDQADATTSLTVSEPSKPAVKTFDIDTTKLQSYTVNGETKFKYFCLEFPITQSGSNYLFDCKHPIKVDVLYFDTSYSDRTDTAFASFVLNADFVLTSSTHYGWKNVYNVYNDGAKYISAGANIATNNSNEVIVKYINPAPDVYEWIISRDTNNNPCILFPIGINKSFNNTVVQLKVTVSGLPSDGQGDVTVYYDSPGPRDDMSVSLASVNNEIQ